MSDNDNENQAGRFCLEDNVDREKGGWLRTFVYIIAQVFSAARVNAGSTTVLTIQRHSCLNSTCSSSSSISSADFAVYYCCCCNRRRDMP